MKVRDFARNSAEPPSAVTPNYWQQAQGWKGAARHITFEVSQHESWSFPRAHLKCFEYWKTDEKWHLQFSFPALNVVVQSNVPEQLLKAVLDGTVSVLVWGTDGRISPSPEVGMPQTEPPFHWDQHPGTACTGPIQLHYHE